MGLKPLQLLGPVSHGPTATVVTRPPRAAVTLTVSKSSHYYPNLLCINGGVDNDHVSNDEPTLLGEEPRSVRRVTITTIAATFDDTMLFGSSIRHSLFPRTRRTTKVPRSKSSAYKGTSVDNCAKLLRNVGKSWQGAMLGLLVTICSSLATYNPS